MLRWPQRRMERSEYNAMSRDEQHRRTNSGFRCPDQPAISERRALDAKRFGQETGDVIDTALTDTDA